MLETGVLSFRPQAGRGPAGELKAVLFLCPDPDFRISIGRKNGLLNNESLTITRQRLLGAPEEVQASELWLRNVWGQTDGWLRLSQVSTPPGTQEPTPPICRCLLWVGQPVS